MATLRIAPKQRNQKPAAGKRPMTLGTLRAMLGQPSDPKTDHFKVWYYEIEEDEGE